VNTFSALECSQDDFTTVPTTAPPDEPTTTSKAPKTTTPERPNTVVSETTITVNPIDNCTSSEPETMSPSNEPETTTKEVIKTTTSIRNIPKYVVKDGDIVCIVIQGNIRFDILYERNDRQVRMFLLLKEYHAETNIFPPFLIRLP
jgi:hypothetical protein